MPRQRPAPGPESRPGSPRFRERRRVPWWWWLVALAIALPSVEIVAVFAPDMSSHGSWVAWVVAGAATAVVVAAAMIALSRSDVVVDDRGLHAGDATLPTAKIGRVRVLDRESARLVLGRDARANARLSIRPWVHTAVQIEVDDAADPTPYWVVGTRRPHELATALAHVTGRQHESREEHAVHEEQEVREVQEEQPTEGGRS